MARVIMVHTVQANTARFQALADELLPGVAVEHVVDESLLQDTITAGHLTDAVEQRFAATAHQLRAAEPTAIVLTCSSVGPAADHVAPGGAPVLRIDTAMAEAAVAAGRQIGVAATLPTTLQPTAELIQAAADRAGRTVEVRTALAEGTFALLATDPAEHDRRVRQCLADLASWADVIVLAQASMTRAVDGDAIAVAGRSVPLLTSPRLGVQALARQLGV